MRVAGLTPLVACLGRAGAPLTRLLQRVRLPARLFDRPEALIPTCQAARFHRRGGQRRGLRERRASFQPQPTNLRARGPGKSVRRSERSTKASPESLLGGLLQNPISFAYTSSDPRPVSTLLVQPILLKHLWRGLYAKSADATWAIGERAGSGTTLPLSFGLGYVIPREGSPPINVFVSGQWMAYRQDAPVAPQTTVRFGMTIAFPEWTRWKGF